MHILSWVLYLRPTTKAGNSRQSGDPSYHSIEGSLFTLAGSRFKDNRISEIDKS